MKQTRSRFMRTAAAAGAAALVLTACGNGNGNGAAGGIEAVEPFFPVAADGSDVLPCGGYGFRFADGDFWEAFNDQLNEFRQDGTTLELITAYDDFAPADVEKASELTANDIAPNANANASFDSGTLADLQADGSITIGVANEVPFGYVGDDGEATGIAPDVARAVLAELGITEIQVDVVEFGQLIGGLQAGQFDLIAAGMYINSDRAEQILFSDPDYCIAESLAVAAGNPHGIVDYSSFVDNPDLTIAVATGTVEVGYVEDAGVPDSQVRVFADIDGMYDALEAGEVDAVTGTAATVARQVAARSN